MLTIAFLLPLPMDKEKEVTRGFKQVIPKSGRPLKKRRGPLASNEIEYNR